MALTKEMQFASRKPVVDIEEQYTVQAGDSEGCKYTRDIQYGYDFEFQCNHKAAVDDFNKATRQPIPRFKGKTAPRGSFSERAKFRATWARVYRNGELVAEWES